MKTITTLLVSGLLIGNFVSSAEACMERSSSVQDSASVMQMRKSTMPRVSRRTLENNVRSTWKQVKTTTKGF